jgi:putative ABC transport system permease protein
MLTRILRGSLLRRRRRKLLSLLAVALGIAAATAVATLTLSVGDKVSRELRSFGANIAVTPAADSLAVTVGGIDYRPAGAGAYLPQASLVNLRKIFWRNNIVAFAPFVYLPVSAAGRRAVLVGSWFRYPLQVSKSEVFTTGLEDLHPAWQVRGAWPDDSNLADCLVGSRLAARWGVRPGQALTLDTGLSSQTTLRVRGILESGGAEDDQVLAPLATVQKLGGLEGKVRRVEVSALTKPQDAFARADRTRMSATDFDRWFCTPYVTSIAYQIEQAIPGAEAKPVYRVAATEGKILDRVGMLMAVLAAAALAAAALAVSSMMLATVLERRAEIGLFKSLGATDARVAALFLLEAGFIGLGGGLLGYLAGSLLARGMAVQIFGASAAFNWLILPAALALALLVTLLGSAWPLGRGLKISPAVVLRD